MNQLSNSSEVGKIAEQAAEEYFKKLKHKIIEKNWKTPKVEIDLITMKGSTMHFVEVKYRKNHQSGGGLEYISKDKVRRMSFGATLYCHSNNMQNMSICLVAVELSGTEYKVDNYVEIII